MTYYGPKEWEPYVTAFWDPNQFLNSEWSYEKQKAFNDLYNFSVFGWSPFRDQFDSILDSRNDQLYLDRYGLDWSDVKDPRKLSQSKRSASVNAINFVSSNIKRLYR